jgi:hypothetical protein
VNGDAKGGGAVPQEEAKVPGDLDNYIAKGIPSALEQLLPEARAMLKIHYLANAKLQGLFEICFRRK